jgi:hypothetical protein
MRCAVPVLFLFAAAVLTVSGCGGPGDSVKQTGGTTPGTDVLILEVEEIDLVPGEKREVKLKAGKADTADAPKESGVSVKTDTDGKTVTITADKDAKEGTHQVTVKGGKAKEAALKVHVKKKDKSD